MEDKITLIRNKGVVGAGGGGFPTYQKLIKAKDKIDTIIANGAECEPLLSTDKYLLSTFPEKVINGLEIVQDITKAKNIIIAFKKKQAYLFETLITLSKSKQFKIYLLEDLYPVGDEIDLCFSVTGRIPPPRGLPLNVGVLVQNVTTLSQIFEAINNKPVIRRFVSIIGAIKNPGIYNLPIGTNFKDIISECGGITAKNWGIIDGGPMTGVKREEKDMVVRKTTSAILVVEKTHPSWTCQEMPFEDQIWRSRAVCDSCRICTETCPRVLLGYPIDPQRIILALNYQKDDLETLGALLCSGCNVCTLIACPEKISVKIINTMLSKYINKYLKEAASRLFAKVNPPRPEREYRLYSKDLILARLGFKEQDLEYQGDFEPNSVKLPLDKELLSTVSVGQKVKEGDIVAIPPKESLYVPLHASISGEVVSIDSQYIEIHAN
jgi:Na+-translocating ferredoxin:NAD+ oxidoreductase RnfC subunit